MWGNKVKELRKISKKERIYFRLVNSGARGVSNWDLSHISLRYGAVIFDLRKAGYTISTNKKKDGLVIYILEK